MIKKIFIFIILSLFVGSIVFANDVNKDFPWSGNYTKIIKIWDFWRTNSNQTSEYNWNYAYKITSFDVSHRDWWIIEHPWIKDEKTGKWWKSNFNLKRVLRIFPYNDHYSHYQRNAWNSFCNNLWWMRADQKFQKLDWQFTFFNSEEEEKKRIWNKS